MYTIMCRIVLVTAVVSVATALRSAASCQKTRSGGNDKKVQKDGHEQELSDLVGWMVQDFFPDQSLDIDEKVREFEKTPSFARGLSRRERSKARNRESETSAQRVAAFKFSDFDAAQLRKQDGINDFVPYYRLLHKKDVHLPWTREMLKTPGLWDAAHSYRRQHADFLEKEKFDSNFGKSDRKEPKVRSGTQGGRANQRKRGQHLTAGRNGQQVSHGRSASVPASLHQQPPSPPPLGPSLSAMTLVDTVWLFGHNMDNRWYFEGQPYSVTLDPVQVVNNAPYDFTHPGCLWSLLIVVRYARLDGTFHHHVVKHFDPHAIRVAAHAASTQHAAFLRGWPLQGSQHIMPLPL
jgi:hypothetical protein